MSNNTPGIKLVASRDPLDMLASRIERKLSRKLGRHVVPFQLPPVASVENLQKWVAFNMQPVFLPELDLTEDCRLPKRWIRLGSGYYQMLREGGVGEFFPGIPPTKVQPGWYLADMSVGVDCTDETRVFPNDPWMPLFTRLRSEELIGGYPGMPAGSRFAISHDNWSRIVLGFMASEMGFSRVNLRLERTSEFNVIGNIYDVNRGRFNMLVWFADSSDESDVQLCGGNCDHGGLAHVSFKWTDTRYRDVAARPLVSLV